MKSKASAKKRVALFIVFFVVCIVGSYATLRHLYSSYAFVPFVPVCNAEGGQDEPARIHELQGQLTQEFLQQVLSAFESARSGADPVLVRQAAGKTVILQTLQEWLAQDAWGEGGTPVEQQIIRQQAFTIIATLDLLKHRHPGLGVHKIKAEYGLRDDQGFNECDVLKDIVIIGGKYAGDEKPEPDWRLPEWYMKYFSLDGRNIEEGATPRWYYAVTTLFEPGRQDDTEQDNAP